jgi:phage terminase large subunit
MTFNLLPKQLDFINSTDKFVLYSSGLGAGKTLALCYAILKEAAIKNNTILLVRKTYTALRRTTLPELLKILPDNSYTYNKVEQKIVLNGYNSTIWLIGLDDTMKIRSINAGFIAVDEATELTEEDWIELKGRLRSRDGSRRMVAACNPSSPNHFLYQIFYVNKKDSHKLITAKTTDNYFLPEDYVESLKELPENLYNRLVLGLWTEIEKAIYPMFNKDSHIKTRGHGEFSQYYLGVDFGFTNPTAMILAGIDGDNNIHILDEYKKSKMLLGDIVSYAEQKYYKLSPVVIVDPSAPALVAEFDKAGFNTKKANNAVLDGITRVQTYFHNNKITIDPKCIELVKELELYSYTDGGSPVKINDHLCDSLRYITNEIATIDTSPKTYLLFSDEEEDDEF